MRKIGDYLRIRMRWLPIDGKDIDLWTDNWTGLGTLRNHFQGPLSKSQEQWKVSNLNESKQME